MIIAAIISLFLAVYIVAQWTVNRMKKEQYVDHRRPVKEWLIKAGSGIPAIILFSWQQKFIVWIIASGMVMLAYWLLFDITIGLLLGKGMFYSGTVWAGRAKTANVPFVVKLVLVAIMIWLYIKGAR